MSNLQLYLAIGLPTLLLLIGQLLNWSAVKDVSSRLLTIESDLDSFTALSARWKAAST